MKFEYVSPEFKIVLLSVENILTESEERDPFVEDPFIQQHNNSKPPMVEHRSPLGAFIILLLLFLFCHTKDLPRLYI